MNLSTAAGLTGQSTAPNMQLGSQPEKWDNLKDVQKIERMRDIIKQLEFAAAHLDEKFYKLQSIIENHSHTVNGVRVSQTVNESLWEKGLSGSANISTGSEFF